MNYWTLTFDDKFYEKQFIEEQFEVEKTILKRNVIMIVLVGMAAAINNFVLGNFTAATITLIMVLIIFFTVYHCMKRIIYVDILILIVQFVVNSLIPLVVLFDQSIGSFDTGSKLDIYAQGLLIAYLSFSVQLGSKYYIKAIPYVYALFMQILVIGIKGLGFTFPFEIYFIAASICCICHVYYSELGRRRNFIQVKQNSQYTLNVLSTFNSPHFSCYLDEFALKLFHANDCAIKKFGISDQKQFLGVLRGTTINDIDLERHLYQYISKTKQQNINPQDIITITGSYNDMKFKYYISSYLDEEREQVVLVNIQKIKDYVILPIEVLHNQVIRRLVSCTKSNLDPLLSKRQHFRYAKYQIYNLWLGMHNAFLYSNLLLGNQISEIILLKQVQDIFNKQLCYLKSNRLSIRVKIINTLTMLANPQKLYLTMSNLISYCVNQSVQLGTIYISAQQNNNIVSFVFQFHAKQQEQIDDFELQMAGYLICQQGPHPYILSSGVDYFKELKFQLYQSQLADQPRMRRKASQYNFIKEVISSD